MYFGANTFIWESPFTTRKISLLKKIRNMGFEAVEIAVEDPDLIDPAVVRDELIRTGLIGLICGVFGPDRDINSPDPAVATNAKNYLRWCIAAAHTIGSPVVCGPMYSATGKARLLTTAERRSELRRTVEGLAELCDDARAFNVRLAIEPLNRFETDMVNTVAQGLDLIAATGRSNLGLHLDTFHMHLEEKDSAAAIRLAGSQLFHFHASENDRGTPGSGQVHWKEISAALREIHYPGAVVIESFTPRVTSIARAVNMWRDPASSQDELATEGLHFLRQLFDGA
jgi:D-psicose/D-tagatose/L-ribulose 3-epimerase